MGSAVFGRRLKGLCQLSEETRILPIFLLDATALNR